MSDQGQNELNQKVARLLGWRSVGNYGRHKLATMQATIWTRGGIDEDADIRYSLPDYCNDLNACAEFEKGLPANLRDKYLDWLADATETPESDAEDEEWRLTTATAEQRCRAFVATMKARSVGDSNEKSLADQGSPKSESLGANK